MAYGGINKQFFRENFHADGNSKLHEGDRAQKLEPGRTAYTMVTLSKSYLPDEVGALVWLSQYKPSMFTFIPLHDNIDEVTRITTILCSTDSDSDSDRLVSSLPGIILLLDYLRGTVKSIIILLISVP